MGCAKLRVVDLRTLLLDGAPWIPAPSDGIIGVSRRGHPRSFMLEHMMVPTYMVDLKPGGVRKKKSLPHSQYGAVAVHVHPCSFRHPM